MHETRWLLAIAVASAVWEVDSSALPQKPDILFIAVDDLNDWTGCLGGHPQARTPNLDRLAARGVLFENAQCAAPACNPSRAALMSGLRPFTTGIYYNHHQFGPVLRDVLTLNRYLRQQGYRVIGGGKIYHGAGGLPGEPQKDWDEYFHRPSDPKPPRPSMTGLNREQFDWGPLDVDDDAMGDYQLVTWAAQKLQERDERPLFLAVGFVKPHLPWYVPRKYFDLFPLEQVRLPEVISDDLADIPAAGIAMAKPDDDHKAVVEAGLWRHGVQAYLATIAFLDVQIGRLIEAADQSWRSNRLCIVLWSDHGWHLGEKQHWRKFTLWEESARAPYLIVAPGVATPGGRCRAPVDFMTIYPTLCELAGLPVPSHVQGRSVVPLLRDPSAQWTDVGLTTYGRGNHSVRTARWRYIRYADGSEELYDHSNDPNEWTNLAARVEYRSVIAELARHLPSQEAQDAPRTGRRSQENTDSSSPGQNRRDRRPKEQKGATQ